MLNNFIELSRENEFLKNKIALLECTLDLLNQDRIIEGQQKNG